tara:strand:+ start:1140 stop:1490 length:351 start_codon:yes stop_codon:yes gene_type:complete
MKCVMFYLQLLIIIMVSMIDIFYTLLTRESILTMEQNPIARWVIQNHGVDKFISIKTATTCLVVLTLQWFYYNTKERNKKAMWVILTSVTIFQLGLLIWLITPPATWYNMRIFLGL